VQPFSTILLDRQRTGKAWELCVNADPSANTEGTTIFAKNLTVPIVSPETPPELKNEERGKYFYLVNRWSDLVAYF